MVNENDSYTPVATGNGSDRDQGSQNDHVLHIRNSVDYRTPPLARFDTLWPAKLADLIATLLVVAIAWNLLLVHLPPALMNTPGGSIASIFVLYVSSIAAGRVLEAVCGLPPLIGMMVAGIFLQNYNLYIVNTDWCIRLMSVMREAALSVILIKSGLGLNPDQLSRLSGTVAKLTVLPCVAEAIAAGIAAHYLLPNYSWEWGLILGFTLSAVSPAILVPSLWKLKQIGYGEENGVDTLVIAASSLDDIVSISAFGILVGVVFSTGNLTSKIIQGPVDVGIGTVLGLIWGAILILIPPSPWSQAYENGASEQREANELVTAKRSFLLGAGGFLAVTGSQRYGYPGAGPLACIVSAFVASTGWNWRTKEQKKSENSFKYHHNVDGENDDGNRGDTDQSQEDPVEKVFELLWVCFQPILFASIGTEIKFELLKDGNILITGLLVIICGLIIRLVATTFSVIGTGFNSKEITFINIAWLPKATVQAALAPVALDMAMHLGSNEDKESASQLVTIAVISILVTAPLGAFGIHLFGPRLLTKSRG